MRVRRLASHPKLCVTVRVIRYTGSTSARPSYPKSDSSGNTKDSVPYICLIFRPICYSTVFGILGLISEEWKFPFFKDAYLTRKDELRKLFPVDPIYAAENG